MISVVSEGSLRIYIEDRCIFITPIRSTGGKKGYRDAADRALEDFGYERTGDWARDHGVETAPVRDPLRKD